MTAPRILLAIATIVLAACNASAPPMDRERRVGSPVSVVSTDDSLDCEDECGEPDCSCVEDLADDPAPR